MFNSALHSSPKKIQEYFNQARAPDSNEYPSFADRLIDNGIIRINAFGMWLDVESRVTILFGGVDKI